MNKLLNQQVVYRVLIYKFIIDFLYEFVKYIILVLILMIFLFYLYDFYKVILRI